MFKRILIANRGEIARRIARTCRRLGIETVAVHSKADRTSAHLDEADGREVIGGAAAIDSYLNGAAILAAARRTGCDALHPGYGFLSENAAFAQATGDAGLIFIGPPPDVIAAMGDKAEAKRRVAAAGVPVVPGSEEASEHPAEIRDACHRIGYPVILKPVAGGGGKGMTVVRREEDLSEAIERAIRLGRANFADGRLLVERFIANPRHIEVQIFGDAQGRIVHLFERECTLQRNHQKIVEEAPAGALPEATRAALLAAAVRGAEAIGYRNAGTFEFILAPDGAFYFLEVNTRLQVEHPVTEAITGLDLVEWQLRVAAGEALPLSQDEIRRSGHAIECRIYAEDPDNDFQPAPGEALAVRWPAGCRVDAAFDGAGTVPPFYDPMVAKLIVRGHDRADSLHRLLDAVQETVILGLTTNLGFLARLLQDRQVIAGDMDTHLVDRLAAEPPPAGLVAAATAAAIGLGADGGLGTGGAPGAG
ncbi:MAG: ATP-grasp domain-containing protein, partial [Telmatospirillum sp.]|nr:ATP-grasp domain-containing protein [Telmatospirillum sp.]